MEVRIDGSNLVIMLPMYQAPVPSSTGKSLLVASSQGAQPTTCQVGGKVVKVAVNAFIPR